MVTETQTVTEQVEVYKPLPKSLTDPVAYPAALPIEFNVEDLIDLTFALFDALDQANQDKADAGELTQPGELASVPE